MKSNLMILLRCNFQALWGSLRYNKRKKKFIPMAAIFVLGGIGLVAIMAFYAAAQVMIFKEQGTPAYAVYFMVAQTMMIMLLMAVVRGGASNTTTDADFLLSLPLKRGTILLSKSLSQYLFDLLPVAAVLLPGLVVYGVMVEGAAPLLLRGLLAIFLLPLCSVGLAHILSYLVFKVSSRFRRPEYIRTGLMLVVTVAFMILIMGMSGAMGGGGDLTAFMNKMPPLAWGAEFAAFGGLDKLGLFLVVTVLPFAVGILLQSKIYGASQTRWRAKKSTLIFRQHSPLRALFSKEMRQYFSVPIYVVNTILGPVLALVTVVALVLARDAVAGFLTSDPDLASLGDYLPILLVTMLLFFTGMTTITASAISLEGKSIRILRAAPVAEKDIFKSKILVHLVLTLPVFVPCATVTGIVMKLGARDTLLTTLCMAVMTVLVAVLGLYVNLVFPKMEWDSETVVVKQSAAVGITIFAGFLFDAIPLILFFALGQDFILSVSLSIALFMVLTAGIWLLTVTDGKKRYREL